MARSGIYMICSILSGILLCFMITTTLSWSSPIIPKLTNITTSPLSRAINLEEASWISSIVALGSLAGVNTFGYLIHKFGRKPSLIVAGLPYLLGHIIIAYTTSVKLYYFARFLMGLTVGSSYVLAVYLAEITHKNHRGTLMTSTGCVAGSGLIFSNVLGTFLSIRTFSLIQVALSALYIVVFSLFGEESPRYYILNGKELEARISLGRLRNGYDDIDEMLSQIQSQSYKENKGSLNELFSSKPLMKAFVISSVLLIFQQLCGMVAILYYGQTFFQYSSFALSPEISMTILSVINFLGSFSTPLLSANFGIKYALCLSGIGMFLSESVLALYCFCGIFVTITKFFDVLPLYCLTMFIIAYNSGFGSLPWILVGELFPTRVKGLATCLVGSISYISSFIMTRYFICLIEYMDIYGYLALSACCCLLATAFVKCYVIETKGKSLEDIQRELSN